MGLHRLGLQGFFCHGTDVHGQFFFSLLWGGWGGFIGDSYFGWHYIQKIAVPIICKIMTDACPDI